MAIPLISEGFGSAGLGHKQKQATSNFGLLI